MTTDTPKRKQPNDMTKRLEAALGCEVLRSRLVDRRGGGTRETRVILVDRGGDRSRYATAIHCETDQEWFSGNYFNSFSEALADYEKRVSEKRADHGTPGATRCPVCDSDTIQETDKFDLTNIGPEECTHDFECLDCEALFTVTYTFNHTSLVARNVEALR